MREMLKKNIALALSALMLLSVATGCKAGTHGNTSSAGSDSNATGAPVKLTIAARGGTHVDVIKAVKDKFEKENNCTIEVLGLEADDLKQKVSLDSKNSAGAYDLCMIDDPVVPELASTGVLLDLTKQGYKPDSDFVATGLNVGKNPYAKGDIYALPFAGNVTVLCYNKDVLSSVNANVPDNWDDVLKIAKEVNGKNGKVGYVIRGQQGNPIVGDYLPILWSYGGNVFDSKGNVTVDSAEGKASLIFYKQLLTNGANYEKNDICSAMNTGKSALSLAWPSWYVDSSTSKVAFARIPGKINSSSKSIASGVIGNWLMGVTKNSSHKKLAIKLLEYLTSAEAQRTGTTVGGVPTRTSVLNDSELQAKHPSYKVLLEAMKNANVRPRTPLWSQIEEAYGIELSNAISGKKDVNTALADAKNQIERITK